jgi:hypothetical protein
MKWLFVFFFQPLIAEEILGFLFCDIDNIILVKILQELSCLNKD